MEQDPDVVLAQSFVDARQNGQRLDGKIMARRLTSMDQAYAVQRHTARLIGDRIAGWKIGCSNLAQQKMFNVREPFYGPVFARDIMNALDFRTARLETRRFPMLGIECEIMFRLGRDILPADDLAADLPSAIDAVMPGFEIFSSRIDRPFNNGVLPLVADCGGNGALVTGTPFLNWPELDLANSSVTLDVDGVNVAEGTGSVVLGNPYHCLEWFVESCRSRGESLEAGQIIACGSMTPVYWAEPTQKLRANFGVLGDVTLEICG